jgi:hypothetical protein
MTAACSAVCWRVALLSCWRAAELPVGQHCGLAACVKELQRRFEARQCGSYTQQHRAQALWQPACGEIRPSSFKH